MTNLAQYTSLLQSVLVTFAQSSEYKTQLTMIFGEAAEGDTLAQLWSSENFSLPTIEVLEDNTLQGALGAYGTETGVIYLSKSLVESGNEQLILRRW